MRSLQADGVEFSMDELGFLVSVPELLLLFHWREVVHSDDLSQSNDPEGGENSQ